MSGFVDSGNGKIAKVTEQALGIEPYQMHIDFRGKNIEQGAGYAIGGMIAEKLHSLGQEYFIVSGDGRLDTYRIMKEISESLTGAGIKVLSCGERNTTPMFDYVRSYLGISGANVTASHQPHEYNGVKLVFCPSSKKEVPRLEQLIEENPGFDGTSHIGPSASRIYLEYLTGVTRGCHYDGLVVLDSLQGTAGRNFETIAKSLFLRHILVREEPDGTFPLTDGGPDPSRYGNLDLLKRFSNADIAHIADGDGDRYGFAVMVDGRPRMLEAPYLAAIRALSTEKRGTFVAEHTLAHIIGGHLDKYGIKVITAKRGRPNMIREIMKSRHDSLGGAEISLHNYDQDGFDDAVKCAFEMHRTINWMKTRYGRSDWIEVLRNLKFEMPSFFPESRVEDDIPPKDLYGFLMKTYAGAKNDDGVLYLGHDVAWCIRASSNEDAKTLNIWGDSAKIGKTFEGLIRKLGEFDRSLAAKFMSDLETKLRQRSEYCL
jgi:phosphomannomutase